MGKYIKKFDTHSDYEDFILTEDFIRPNVSYCVDNVEVHYNPIFWAYELEPGHFVAGEILNNILYFYTPVASGNKWIFDSNGVVLEDRSLGVKLQDAMNAINERFNTSFIDEDDKDSDLTIGETLPDWDIYKKIELSKEYLAIKTSFASNYLYGYKEGDIFFVATDIAGDMQTVNSDGINQGTSEPFTDGNADIIQDIFETKGYTFNQIQSYIDNIEIEEKVNNWDRYEIIS